VGASVLNLFLIQNVEKKISSKQINQFIPVYYYISIITVCNLSSYSLINFEIRDYLLFIKFRVILIMYNLYNLIHSSIKSFLFLLYLV